MKTSAGAAELCLALLLAAFTLSSLVDFVPRTVGIDFYQFWATGRAVREGETRDAWSVSENVRIGQSRLRMAREEAQRLGGPTRRLQAAQGRAQLDNYSTPFLYTLFGAVASGDYERDLPRFQWASFVAYFGGLAAICWALRYSLVATALCVTACAMWLSPFVDDASTGNVNRLQVGAIAAVIALLAAPRVPMRAAWAGLVLGLAIAFKPNLGYAAVALAAAWALERRWREIVQLSLGGLAGAAIAVASSSAFFGSPAAWLLWTKKLSGLMDTWATDLGNQSLARVVVDRTGVRMSAVITVLVLAAAPAAFVARWLADRKRERAPESARIENDALALALGTAASVLSIRLAWQHYYLLLVPLFLVVFRPGAGRALRRAAATVGLALLSIELPHRVLPAAMFEPAACVVAAAALLFGLGLLDLVRPAMETPSPAAEIT